MRQIAAFRSSAVLLIVLGIIAAAALGRVRPGADFGHYLQWSRAFLSGDLTQMSSPVVSPEGYPLLQHFPGTGALFALPKLVAPTISLRRSALLSALVAAGMLWICIPMLLSRAARQRLDIVLLGIPLVFLATHAGYQSTEAGTELISLALIGVLMVSLNPGSQEVRPFSILVAGCAAGLIMSVRSNLAPYVAAVGAVWAFRILRWRPARPLRAAYLALLGGVPVALGCAQILIVNHWMTGAWTRSPYIFGDQQFRSLDLLHPQFLSVLLHPWHGLLVYHPIYLVLLGTTVAGIVRDRWGPEGRMGWSVLLLAAASTVILQASWYAWWMGLNTFGGRQFSIWAVIFAVPWFQWLADARSTAWTTRVVYVVMGVAASWSYVLLLGGATNFLSGAELLHGARILLVGFVGGHWHLAAIALGVVLLWLLHGKNLWRHAATTVLWSLLVLYLFEDNRVLAAEGHGVRASVVPAVELLTVGLVPVALQQAARHGSAVVGHGAHLWRGVQVVTVLLFALVSALFARLALATPRLPAAAIEQCFSYHTPFDFQEVDATLAEYRQVNGFEPDKERLRAFLTRASERYRTPLGGAPLDQQACLASTGVVLREWR